MEHQLLGIVLRVTPYNDSMDLATLYTSTLGTITLRLSKRGQARSQSAQWRRLVQPLAILELITTSRKEDALHSILDAQIITPANGGIHNPLMTSYYFFMAECVDKLFRYEPADDVYFEHLFHSMQWFQYQSPQQLENFCITFLIHTLRIKGYTPRLSTLDHQPGYWFDLANGEFTLEQPKRGAIHPNSAHLVIPFFRINYRNMHLYQLNHQERFEITQVILYYYQLHHPSFGTINSLSMLESI